MFPELFISCYLRFYRLQCIPQNRRVTIELDNNLNGLSLGLPTQRKNGFNKHTTPENSNKAGTYTL